MFKFLTSLKRRSVSTLLFLLICFLANGQSSYKIVGYVMGSRIDESKHDYDFSKLTHINYAFADVVDGKVVEISPKDSSNFVFLNGLKSQNPDLKILFSIGGWTRSGGFSDAVLTEESREIFAKSAIAYMDRHHLDGIDIDWEYPGLSGNGNTFRKQDKENFTAAIQLIRDKLDEKFSETGKPYLLTIASASSQSYLDNVEMDKISKPLDFINIMTYDYFGPWSARVGNHAQLFPYGDQAVKRHLDAGVPPEKLVLGVAFYGRGWKGVQGMDSLVSKEAFSLGYRSIKDSLMNDYQGLWEEQWQFPHAWKKESQTWIGYDSPRSMEIKANYVKSNGLGGIMFWEYHGDANGELQRSIQSSLNTIPAHSHNDYEGDKPLFEALSLGFKSIEVDVHLIDDQLYVSHDRPRKLNRFRTLEALYLNPLKKHNDFIQSPLFLLIDVKTDATKTHEKLVEVLSQYQMENVKYIISGNRDIDRLVEEGGKLMSLDGRKLDIDSDYSLETMPLISDNYRKFFSSKDITKIDRKEIAAFEQYLKTAHAKGLQVRLWASPDHPEMWQFLQNLGVDLINTDKIEAFSKYYFGY